jgi:transglutaminase-like putative cysteine protease
MRLEIRYLNEFTYDEPARESHNLLRACPANDPHQSLVSYRLDVSPEAKVVSYTDYWGTRVDEFGIREPHRALRICAESVVESQTPSPPAADSSLDDYTAIADGMSEYLRPSPHATWDVEVGTEASRAVDGHQTALGAIQSVIDSVRSHMEYAPGATFVGMPVGDVLAQGKGVCQDFAHLGIAMLRSIGIPARYVSGTCMPRIRPTRWLPRRPSSTSRPTLGWKQRCPVTDGGQSTPPTRSRSASCTSRSGMGATTRM